MCTNQHQKIDYQVIILLTRLSFVSTPNPGEFCINSEIISNLENDLIYYEECDPLVLTSPYSQQLPNPLRLDDAVTFGAAEETDVKMAPQCKGGSDEYIDDGATEVLDSPINGRMV